MKRTKYILLAVIFGVLAVANSFAQITTEFSNIEIRQANYQDIKGNPLTVVVDEDDIIKTPMSSRTKDLDDGYVKVPLGFKYEFNGETYEYIYVNVNGFATFGRMDNGRLVEPPLLLSTIKNAPNAFFNDDPSFPVNVLAPFWGDHYYREENSNFDGYLPSEISILTETDANGFMTFTVQWKNININYLLGTEKIKSSVANFQLKIYQSTQLYTRQGDIEFCYGQIGGNINSNDTRVITNKSVVGMKGYKKAQGTGADYLNGLVWDDEIDITKTTYIMEGSKSAELSNQWTPSGATNSRIRFTSYGRSKEKEWWGDGDCDFSKVTGGRHNQYAQYQNRWVTPNDARVIMNSIATKNYLDPTIERAAYHGDVNHNGRYFFNTTGNKVNITWKNEFYDDSLENDITKEISNPKQQIYFQVTEYDASLILFYIGGKIIGLPFLLDENEIVKNPKVNPENIATGINIGTIQKVSDNVYTFPVYLNGDFDGAVGFKFDVNGTVENVVANGDYTNLLTSNGENTVVVSGSGIFDSNNPICYVTVSTENKELNFTNVRLNDRNHNDIILAAVEVKESNNKVLKIIPNPATSATTEVNVNVEKEGVYNVSIFDAMGNNVMNIANSNLTVGLNAFTVNVNTLAAGCYFVKCDGNNTVVTTNLIVE